MMFLAPAFLIAAGVAALAVAGLHFLSTRDPKLELLPTTRFLPDLSVRATATTVRPTDPWLLLLRVALVLLVGTALAAPVLTPPRQPVIRIVGVDVSRAVGDPAALIDSAGAYLPGAGAVILFDSAAVEVRSAAGDSLRTRLAGPGVRDERPGERPRGSLSAALLAARRAAARLRDRADSLELVLVSPFVAEARDAATDTLRALWPGRITTVRVAAAVLPEAADSVVLAWADSGGVADWVARSAPDTIAGLRAADAVVVHPFIRRWRLAGDPPAGTRVLARWADGEPAGLERAAERGCVRSLGFAMPGEGDALLRPSVQRLIDVLESPCGEPRDFGRLGAEAMASLEGDGPLVPTAEIGRRVERVTALAPWLLLAAALLAILELFVRRRSGKGRAAPATTRPDADAGSTGRAA